MLVQPAFLASFAGPTVFYNSTIVTSGVILIYAAAVKMEPVRL